MLLPPLFFGQRTGRKNSAYKIQAKKQRLSFTQLKIKLLSKNRRKTDMHNKKTVQYGSYQ